MAIENRGKTFFYRSINTFQQTRFKYQTRNMCGIIGAIPGQEENEFLHALNTMIHRGPDGFGVWHDEDNWISLGHRRLSILDLSENGKQPMFYDRFVITFNGEIFNFMEIKAELESKGYRFRSDSDTEVIVAAYMEWGVDCLPKFNGMWAFGIWDTHKKELFLSRDRFGIKPLYYALVGEQLIFSSEMKGIFPFLSHLSLSKDFEFCKNNMFDYEVSDKCLIEGIRRFPAGHYAVIDAKRPQNWTAIKWWNTLDTIYEVPGDFNYHVERFRELFLDSIKLRMRSDVRVGTALSGGVDSSSVICSMANINRGNDTRVSNDWQNAFVATFPNTMLDESKYAQQVVDHLGVNAVFKEIDPAKGLDKLEEYLWLFEELYITSPIPMIEIYKTIKENGVTVSLDGHGADELLAGYGGNMFDAVMDSPFNVGKIQNLVNTFVEYMDFDEANTSLKNKVRLYKRAYKQVLVRYRDMMKGDNSDPERKKLGRFNRYLYSEFHEKVLPTLLRNYDRYSMAASVEIRMPFMDHRLVSYCFSLPWHSKLRGGYTKAVLRHAMDPFVPKDVIWRKSKIGFNTPFAEWMKGAWKEYLLDTVHSTDFKQSDVIDSHKVQTQIEQVIKSEGINYDAGKDAWVSLTPYLWEKAVLKGYRRPAIL